MDKVKIHIGDCLEVLKTIQDSSVDSIVTDPPYGLSFMGKKWDYDVPTVSVWEECLRVLKPGGHLLAFAGTRTQHRMAVRIEDAGFEIRDMIAWVYGSGFPKSLDVSKAIDKAAGAVREVVVLRKLSGKARVLSGANFNGSYADEYRGSLKDYKDFYEETAPATDAARQWQGWGTALKPALEPITLARKPLAGTVAENVLAHWTGALNINGCRLGGEADRWPANLIHDGSQEVIGLFPYSISGAKKPCEIKADRNIDFMRGLTHRTGYFQSSKGSAARFFYCAKASKSDRDEGIEGIEGIGALRDSGRGSARRKNHHPTVKPTDLMRYLVRLVTPHGGVVLDPFMGSGSTGKAAVLEGFSFIGIEREAEYFEIAESRISFAAKQGVLI